VGLSAVHRSHAALNLPRAEADPLRPSRLTRAHADLLVLRPEGRTRVEASPLCPEGPVGAKTNLTVANR